MADPGTGRAPPSNSIPQAFIQQTLGTTQAGLCYIIHLAMALKISVPVGTWFRGWCWRGKLNVLSFDLKRRKEN